MDLKYFNDIDSDIDRLFLGVGVFLLIFLLSHIVRFLLKIYLKYKSQRTKSNIDDILVAIFEKPVPILIKFFGLYLCIEIYGIEGKAKQIFNYILIFFIFFIIIQTILRIIDVVFKQIIPAMLKFSSRGESDYKLHIDFLRKLSQALAFFISVILLIRYLGYNADSILAGLGISGLAIGLAARETLSSIISSFVITLIDRNFEVGDRIKIDDKNEGKVISVGIRSTLIKTRKDSKLYIPNSKVTSSTLENFGRTDFEPEQDKNEES